MNKVYCYCYVCIYLLSVAGWLKSFDCASPFSVSNSPQPKPSKEGIASNHLYVLNFLNHAVRNTVASDERLQDKRKLTGNVSVRDCNSVLLTADSKAGRWLFSMSHGPSI